MKASIDLKKLTAQMIALHKQAEAIEEIVTSLRDQAEQQHQAILATLRMHMHLPTFETELYVTSRECEKSPTGTCVIYNDHACWFCERPDDFTV